MLIRLCRALLSVCVLAASPVLVVAQSRTPAPQTDPGTARFESQVVVTATRSETASGETPVATSVVTGDELRVRNVQTLDQGLNLIEGVFVFRTKGIADPTARVMLRGFNGANRSLVLLDGQPMNDSYAGEVMWATLPNQMVERVEVVRGSSSSLYGGNAMGGVINILTKPVARRSGTATAQYGTHGTADLAGLFADRFGRTGLTAGGQRVTTDGYRNRPITVAAGTGTTGTPATGAEATLSPTGTPVYVVGQAGKNWYEQNAGRIRGEWAHADAALLTAHYVFQSSESGHGNFHSTVRGVDGEVIDRGPVLIDDRGAVRQLTFTPGTFVQGAGDTRSHVLNISYRHALDRHLIQGSVGVNHQPNNSTRTPVAATATFDEGPGSIAIRDSRGYFVNGQVTTSSGTGGELIGGVEMRREWSDNRDFALIDWTDRRSASTQTFASHGDTLDAAGFAQLRQPLGDKVALTGGVRFDHWRTFDGRVNIFNAAVPPSSYEPRTNDAVTGRVSAVVSPSESWTFRGSVGSAFRNPNVFELYRTFRLSTGTVFYASPDLEPERNLGYELGAVRRFGAGASLEVAYFRNETTDLIYRTTDLVADPTGRTRVLVNAGEAVTNGIEISSRVRLRPWAQLRGQYTWTDAVISSNPALVETEGKKVPFTPPHMASVSLLLAAERWSGSIAGRYVAGYHSLDTNLDTTKGVVGSYSAFFVAAVSGSYTIGRGVEAFGSVENLTDRQYYVFYLNPGRTLNVGLRVGFGR